MSSDFSSLVACLEASSARNLTQPLEGAESVQPIVDADGVTLHDFATQDQLSPRAHVEKRVRDAYSLSEALSLIDAEQGKPVTGSHAKVTAYVMPCSCERQTEPHAAE